MHEEKVFLDMFWTGGAAVVGFAEVEANEDWVLTRISHWWWNGYSMNIWKYMGLSKKILREDETSWLIKYSDEKNLNDIGHFNTPSHA